MAKLNRNLSCPYCDRIGIKTLNGLSGHVQMQHPEEFDAWKAGGDSEVLDDGEGPAVESGAPPATPSLSRLRTEVSLLELEKKKRSLLQQLGDNQPKHYADIGELTGAGQLDAEVKQRLQSRMFGTEGQQPKNPWWEKLLGNMSVGEAIGLARGALGAGQGGELQGIATVLQLAGAKSFKDLIAGNSQVQLAPESFDLPDGTHIPKGFPLESNLLLAVMKQKGGDPMANALDRALEIFTPLITEVVAEKQATRGIGEKPAQPKQEFMPYTCPKCGTTRTLDVTTAKYGDTFDFKCSNPECGYEEQGVEVCSPEPEPQPQARSSQRRPKRPKIEKQIVFCECGQAIDVTNKPVLSEIECPACGKVGKVTSPDEPLPALEPQLEQLEPKSLEQRNKLT